MICVSNTKINPSVCQRKLLLARTTTTTSWYKAPQFFISLTRSKNSPFAGSSLGTLLGIDVPCQPSRQTYDLVSALNRETFIICLNLHDLNHMCNEFQLVLMIKHKSCEFSQDMLILQLLPLNRGAYQFHVIQNKHEQET